MSSIYKELEVDRFLKTMKVLRIALKTLFTKTEQFLLYRNKTFILQSESESDLSKLQKNRKAQSDNKGLGKHFKTLLDDCYPNDVNFNLEKAKSKLRKQQPRTLRLDKIHTSVESDFRRQPIRLKKSKPVKGKQTEPKLRKHLR